MTVQNSEPPILLFDGECALCSGWVRFILSREKRPEIHFAAAQGATGQVLLRQLGLSLTDWESNFLVEEGVVHFKSDAALAVAGHLGGAWPLARGLKIVPRFIRDWVYNLVARNRYAWFGRIPYCAAPGLADPERFRT